MTENYRNAIEDLKNAKNVEEWNKIRERWRSTLTNGELALIDSGGLIVKLLGRDKRYEEV